MIGKLLGHSQVQITARYAHLAPDPVRAATDRVSANLFSALFTEPIVPTPAKSSESILKLEAK
jgi:hypothetical protein